MTSIDAATVTASALDEMTAAIVGRKAEKAVTLTRVGTERVVLPLTTASFPNDQPTEAILAAVRAIEAQIGYISAALDAVKAELGKPAVPVVTVDVDAVKAAEKAADIRAETGVIRQFQQSYAEKQAAAQNLIWGQPARPPSPMAVGPGWTCPVHVNDTPVQLRSRSARPYRMCSITGCSEFEK